MERLFAALPANAQHTRRFLGVIAGTVPVDEFFSDETLQAIVGAGAEPDRPPMSVQAA